MSLRPVLLAFLALAFPSPACVQPYPNVGEKLDLGVTLRGQDSTTWVGASGRTALILVLATPDSTGLAHFVHTTIGNDGNELRTLQGTWSGDVHASTLSVESTVRYTLPDERALPLSRRVGASRKGLHEKQTLGARLESGRLVLDGGNGSMVGSYVVLQAALARLGSSSPDAAGCAFQVMNLAVCSSQVRIPGFNSADMIQYFHPASFAGTLSGEVHISVATPTTPLTLIGYNTFADFSGVEIDGTQSSQTDTSGDGWLFGTVSFRFQPLALAPDGTATPLPPLNGTIDYGVSDGSGASVRLSNGNATGGQYRVAFEGGGTGTVDAASPYQPDLAVCLGLP
jgi:hypothetical protein